MTRDLPVLTMRQTEVAMLVAQGVTARAIGFRLGIARKTVLRHVEDAATEIGDTYGEGSPRDRVAAWAHALDATVRDAALARIPSAWTAPMLQPVPMKRAA
jgi:DNA-binding NarL/FixJ family response regulator